MKNRRKSSQGNNLTEIESVTVEIGEVSTVIESYLQNCWKWSVEKKSDIMHNCKLYVAKNPGNYLL